MNRNSMIRSAAAALLSVAAMSSMAGPASDAGYQTYRRVVLGDSQVAQPAAPVSRTQVVPGPNAAHLVYLGVDRDEAIAQTRSAGEHPTVRTDGPEQAMNATQIYRRAVLGEDVVATIQTNRAN